VQLRQTNQILHQVLHRGRFAFQVLLEHFHIPRHVESLADRIARSTMYVTLACAGYGQLPHQCVHSRASARPPGTYRRITPQSPRRTTEDSLSGQNEAGEIVAMDNGKVLVLAWKGKRVVKAITTKHDTSTTTIFRRKKRGWRGYGGGQQAHLYC